MLSCDRLSLKELITQTNLNKNTLFEGALSRHFFCFSIKIKQKSFFLTFTPAQNISLKFRTKKASIFFYKKSNPW